MGAIFGTAMYTISDLVDGIDSYSILLSSYSVAVPMDKDGHVDLTGASTNIYLYKGISSITPTISISGTPSGCTASASGITVTINTVTADKGYADILVKDGTTTVGTKRFSFARVRQGASYRHLGAWVIGTSYVNNTTFVDTVSYNGSMYACKVSNAGHAPTGLDTDTYWYVTASKGDAGQSLFTWIKYSNSSDGTDMDDNSTNKKYIGVAYNKLVADESTDPADYSWSLIQGPVIDWIGKWDATTVKIGDDMVVSPKIFSGTVGTDANEKPILTGVAIGRNILGEADASIGIAAYNANKVLFKLNTDGSTVFGDETSDDNFMKVNPDGSLIVPIIHANRIDAMGLKVQSNINGVLQTTFQIANDGANVGKVSIKGDVQSFDYLAGSTGWRIDPTGTAEFNNTIVRGSVILPNAGITNVNSGSEKIRFWAGGSYDNRAGSPFIVLEDGTIKATKGEFSGTFTGNLQIGNINISDSDPNAKDKIASFSLKTDGNARTLITLNENSSYIDTKFTFGNDNERYFYVDNDIEQITVNTDKLTITQFNNNLLTNSGWVSGYSGFSIGPGVSRDTSVLYNGYPTLKSAQTGLAANGWRGFENSTTILAQEGDVFTFSVSTMSNSITGLDGGAGLEIRYYNSAGTRITQSSTSVKPSANNTWQRFSATDTCPAGTYRVSAVTYVVKNGTLWMANPQLERGDVETPWGVNDVEQKDIVFPNRIDKHYMEFGQNMFNIDIQSNTFYMQSNSLSATDFTFAKEGISNGVNVVIDGDLQVNDTIKMGKMTMKRKYTGTDATNQGVDFIFT
jgi:hypothetical protein